MTHSFPSLRSSDRFHVVGKLGAAAVDQHQVVAAIGQPRQHVQCAPSDEASAFGGKSRREERGASAAMVVGLDVDARSEEHTSELQSLMRSSYAVFCLKNKTNTK